MRSFLVCFIMILVTSVLTEESWDQECVPGICIPQTVRLSVTGNPTEMTVGWFTLYKSATSTVKFGTSRNHLDAQVTGNQSSYLESNDNDITFWQHFTTLVGLKPSTKYFYQCGDNFGGWSPVLSFMSAPDSVSNRTFSFAAFGDMGIANSQYTQYQIIKKAQSGDLDLVLHVGDIAYANEYTVAMYESVWDQWLRQLEPATSTIPYMVAPGNHEYSCDDPDDCDYATPFTVYNNRFQMPFKQSGSVNNMWYSFRFGNAHFVIINTETDFLGAPEGEHMFGNQMAWLENDLAMAQNNPEVQWIIAGGHRPIYSSACGYSEGPVPSGNCFYLQKAVEDLFYQYSVDVYICGHVHSYERDYPTYRNKAVITNTTDPYFNPEAPVYIVSGVAGCTGGFATCWNDDQPDWSAFRLTDQHGYGQFTVSSSTLNWEFFSSENNTLIDSFVITKTT